LQTVQNFIENNHLAVHLNTDSNMCFLERNYNEDHIPIPKGFVTPKYWERLIGGSSAINGNTGLRNQGVINFVNEWINLDPNKREDRGQQH